MKTFVKSMVRQIALDDIQCPFCGKFNHDPGTEAPVRLETLATDSSLSFEARCFHCKQWILYAFSNFDGKEVLVPMLAAA